MPLFLLWSGNVAEAFCGTFVGSPGAELVNHTSQVVIARQGTRTTLTLVADYQGALSDFALLIPVPESLDAESVTAVDAALVDRLDRYSTPRLVEYQCDEALSFVSPGCAAAGCSASGSAEPMVADVTVEPGAATGTVTVEAQFQLAEYDVALLAAEGADGLYAWLELNGYEVPEGGEDILQEYIDAGSHFLAAKVHLETVAEAPTRLSPLQLRYDAETWTLPLRIGTISGRGEQEVVIYALTEMLDGDVAIQNYPEGFVEDECMLAPGVEDDFSGYYHGELRATHPSDDEPAWNTEYNWTLYSLTQDTGYHCDPCTVEREELYDAGELEALGFVDPTDGLTATGSYGYYGSSAMGNGALLTRIRMVYDAQDIHQDLVLYTRGTHTEDRQIRYIRYNEGLEFLYPICGVGYVEDPGVCGVSDAKVARGKGRSSVPALLVLMGAAMLGVTTRRRSA